MTVLAHGIGGRADLPVPLTLALYGAGLTIVVSFLALVLLWRRPRLRGTAAGRPLPTVVERLVDGPVLRPVLRAVVLALTLLVLAVALLWHPTGGEDVFEAVRDDVGAWLFVHVSFLRLAPLLGYAVLLLLQGLRSRAAAVSRAALVVYMVFYTAYEVTAGVGTGVLVDYGKDLPPAEQAVLADAVQDFSGNTTSRDLRVVVVP